MVIDAEKVYLYLKQLEREHYHGKVTLGVFDGRVNSIKLDTSVDLEYLASLGNTGRLKKENNGKNS